MDISLDVDQATRQACIHAVHTVAVPAAVQLWPDEASAPRAVQLVLQHGALLDGQDASGNTGMHHAVLRAWPTMVSWLGGKVREADRTCLFRGSAGD